MDEVTGLFRNAWKSAARPALIALVVTMARFSSEKAGLPDAVSMAIGIAWLTLIVGVYFGMSLAGEDRPLRPLVANLLVFSVLSRIPIVVLWWLTRNFDLGTHYDVFPSWGSALVAQFGLGVLQQVVTGGVCGLAAWYLARRSRTLPE